MDTKMIVLSPKSSVFRAEDGQEIVYLTPTHPGMPSYVFVGNGDVLYRSGPDELYYELACWAIGFYYRFDHNLTVGDPHRRRIEQVHRKDPHVIMDNVTFTRIEPTSPEREIMVVRLPLDVFPEDLFGLSDGSLLYLVGDATERDKWINTVKAFIGHASNPMREIAVTTVEPCGYGAFLVTTAERELFITHWFGDRKSLWGDDDAERLDLRRFNIYRSAEGPTITPNDPDESPSPGSVR